MQTQPSPRPATVAAAVIVPMLLILVGAGCFRAAEELSSGAVSPVTTSVGALEKAREITAEEQARRNEEAEMASDDMTVALILTEGTPAPADVILGPTIGCNDRIAYVRQHRGAATDSVVHDALATLFGVKDLPADLYNALAQSKLEVEKIQSRDGVTTEVWIKGSLSSGGACDDPRIRAQIEETVRRFKTRFKVYLNGSESEWRCFGDQSGQCK